MTEPIISIEHLSKRYWVGHRVERRESYHVLREDFSRRLREFGHNLINAFRGGDFVQGETLEEFWALRDITFDVQSGEAIGLIGRNGAGKSTLLKILSRITEPDEGRAIIRGKVASLLEVGTGFHPELTGRENIFLNGAILGMKKTEIRSKFDEIVAFAEVERFLDTPVKRYSSGMYVRLAFSIAAHLDPEILIVDEVLAVGDAEFQKKCLGKMHSVASQGHRTVLFVSHNMQAVQALCDRAILFDAGRIVAEGPARSVITKYLASAESGDGIRTWDEKGAPGDDNFALRAIRVLSHEGAPSAVLDSDHDIYIELEFDLRGSTDSSLCVGFDLTNAEAIVLFRTYQTDVDPKHTLTAHLGRNRWRCRIPRGLLSGGEFYINARVSIHNIRWIVHEDASLKFRINLRHGVSPFWNSIDESNRPGLIAPILIWSDVAQRR